VKNNTEISVPANGRLDLGLAYGSREPLPYDLKSFVCHYGADFKSGHYVSYVRRDGQWYLCDDSQVRIAREDEVKKAQRTAYLFFFQKQAK
jgi:ubiquitin C-terminal hydrolase